jgi:hypothetical protein
MDNYKVIATMGAHVREKPSVKAGTKILYTIGYNLDVDIDESVTAEGAVWRHSPEHKGWIRSDLLDRYAHSAEPTPPSTFPTIPPGYVIAALKDFRDAQALIEHGIKLLEGLKE